MIEIYLSPIADDTVIIKKDGAVYPFVAYAPAMLGTAISEELEHPGYFKEYWTEVKL